MNPETVESHLAHKQHIETLIRQGKAAHDAAQEHTDISTSPPQPSSPFHTLLNQGNASLQRLTLHRLQLQQSAPAFHWTTTGECAVFLLVGALDVTVLRDQHCLAQHPLATTRRTVQHPGAQLVRVAGGQPTTLHFALRSYAADVLIATLPPASESVPAVEPSLVQTHTDNHDVGLDTHRREVRVFPSVPGYQLQCGETLNVPGGWSSWPSHATPEEIARYAEHEEVFFVITPGYGLIRCHGRCVTGASAIGVKEVHNGDAIVTPLGSHEIVFSPGDWGYYAWFYTSFLEKTYNKWGTDGVKTYVK